MTCRTLSGLLLLASLHTLAACPRQPTLDDLRAAFGGERLGAIGSLDHRLSVTDARGQARKARHRLEPATGRLRVEADGEIRWWDGAQGWRLVDGGLAMLGETAAAALRASADHHFLRLLADPATRAETAGVHRLRIVPRSAAPFVAELDPQDCTIRTLTFGDGTTGTETDYREADGLRWPHRFTVRRPSGQAWHGAFSDLSIRPAAAADFGPAEPRPGPRTLPDAPADAAVLAGPGWLSTDANEYNLGFNGRQDLLVFARSEAQFAHSRIYWAERRDGGWSEPRQMPFSDPRYRDSDPWLTPDGQWLYFVSDRPPAGDGPPKKDLDIWRVQLAPAPGTPQHLGSVNSEAYELGPELHDGWLYFNSARPGGPAKLSIWRARLEGAGFGVPQPLGAPFNTGTQQGDFTLSPDGRTAMFWQAGSDQDGELYAARRTADGWSCPVRLPAPFNGKGFDFTPAFTPDGQQVVFASERRFVGHDSALLNGLANLFVAPRRLVEAALDAAAARPCS